MMCVFPSHNDSLMQVASRKRLSTFKRESVSKKEREYGKNLIFVSRQDSWTTRNPRNNGAKWGIIRYLLS